MADVDSTLEVRSGARFREILALLYRGRWIVLVCGTLGLGGMWVYTALTPPTFESKAMVLINRKNRQGFNPFADAVDRREEKLANELATLKTRMIARKVAQVLLQIRYADSSSGKIMSILLRNPEKKGDSALDSVKAVASRLQTSVRFSPEVESDVISITAVRPDPYEAAVVAGTFADVYREQVMLQSRSQSRSVREFLEGRLGEQRAQLNRAESSVKEYMQTTGVVSLDGESNRVVQELAALEGKRDGLSVEIESLSRKVKSIEADLVQQGSTTPSVAAQADDSYIRLLQEQIARLEVSRDVMTAQTDPQILKQDMYRDRLRISTISSVRCVRNSRCGPKI